MLLHAVWATAPAVATAGHWVWDKGNAAVDRVSLDSNISLPHFLKYLSYETRSINLSCCKRVKFLNIFCIVSRDCETMRYFINFFILSNPESNLKNVCTDHKFFGFVLLHISKGFEIGGQSSQNEASRGLHNVAPPRPHSRLDRHSRSPSGARRYPQGRFCFWYRCGSFRRNYDGLSHAQYSTDYHG